MTIISLSDHLKKRGFTSMPDRSINMLIIHCSATRPGMDIGAKEIRNWHVNDNGWNDIGYHDVIRRDGTIEPGRDKAVAGAHCAGYNANSIGVCMVGGIDDQGKASANFTDKQWKALERYVRAFRAQHPKATVHGHNEFSSKSCPSFSVQKWIKENNI